MLVKWSLWKTAHAPWQKVKTCSKYVFATSQWPCFTPWYLVSGSQGRAMCAICQGWQADTEKLAAHFVSLNFFFFFLFSFVSTRAFMPLAIFLPLFSPQLLWRFLWGWGLPTSKLANHPPTFPLQSSLLMSFPSLSDTLQALTFHPYVSRASESQST